MTTHNDMVYALGGVPTVGGVPFFFNAKKKNLQPKYYFVDVNNGDDGKTGLSPTKAFSTIEKAVTTVNARISWSDSPWATNDVILIAPGKYLENLTALPYGASMIGLGNAFDLNGENGVLIYPAAGIAVDCTSVINAHIHNIAFQSRTTSVIFQADNFNRNVMTNCFFVGTPGASPTTTRGLEIVKDMTGNHIKDCKFVACRNGIYINTDNANSKQASGNLLEGLWITGGDQTGIYFDANTVPSYTTIRNSTIGGGGTTLALGLDDDSDLVECYNTHFTATANDPDGTSAGDGYNNCYLNGGLLDNA